MEELSYVQQTGDKVLDSIPILAVPKGQRIEHDGVHGRMCGHFDALVYSAAHIIFNTIALQLNEYWACSMDMGPQIFRAMKQMKLPRHPRYISAGGEATGKVIGLTWTRQKVPMYSHLDSPLLPKLLRLIKESLRQQFPNAVYSSIQLNKNMRSKVHCDSNNIARSYTVAIGPYVGGYLCHASGCEMIAQPWEWHHIDGRQAHSVSPWIGERFSIVAYSHAACECIQDEDIKARARGDGFEIDHVFCEPEQDCLLPQFNTSYGSAADEIIHAVHGPTWEVVQQVKNQGSRANAKVGNMFSRFMTMILLAAQCAGSDASVVHNDSRHKAFGHPDVHGCQEQRAQSLLQCGCFLKCACSAARSASIASKFCGKEDNLYGPSEASDIYIGLIRSCNVAVSFVVRVKWQDLPVAS